MLIRAFLGYVAWPTLAFLAAGLAVYLQRPPLNVDYLALAALIPFIPRFLRLPAFAFVVLADFALSLLPIVHFSLTDAFVNFHDLVYVGWKFTALMTAAALLASCAVAAAGLAIAGGGSKPPRKAAKVRKTARARAGGPAGRWRSLIVFGAATFIVSALSHGRTGWKFSGMREVSDAVSAIYDPTPRLGSTPLGTDEAATGPLLEAARQGRLRAPGRQVALVLVESLGYFESERARAQLLKPFYAPEILARYRVEAGAVPFHGETLQGELRELCGLRLLSYRDLVFPKCLPALLRDRGYDTYAMHGFRGGFYDRAHWYPKAGFAHVYFRDELVKEGLTSHCGWGYGGTCDTEAAGFFRKLLLAGTARKPRFVHWMTLNGHMPLDARSAEGARFDCAANPVTAGDATVCLHTRIISNTLEAVASIASDPKLAPTEFVVVGDHSPAFVRPAQHVAYSDEQIPYVVLTPKSGE